MNPIMFALSLFAMGAVIAVVAYRQGFGKGFDQGWASGHHDAVAIRRWAEGVASLPLDLHGAQKPAQAEGRAYRHECRWQGRTEGDGLTLKGLPEEMHREGSPGP